VLERHSREQEFYVGEDFLLRRHDYQLEVAGGLAAAHYVSDFVEADGLRLPTRRRAYLRDNTLRPMRERLMVSIDVSDAAFADQEPGGGGASLLASPTDVRIAPRWQSPSAG
jgi:hypothetical protein